MTESRLQTMATIPPGFFALTVFFLWFYIRDCLCVGLLMYWPLAICVVLMQKRGRARLDWALILFICGIMVTAAAYYVLWLIMNHPGPQ
jgi:hypothetical protein